MRNVMLGWFVAFGVLAGLSWLSGIRFEVLATFISAGLGVGLLGGMMMFLAKRSGVKVDGDPKRLAAWIFPLVAALVFALLFF